MKVFFLLALTLSLGACGKSQNPLVEVETTVQGTLLRTTDETISLKGMMMGHPVFGFMFADGCRSYISVEGQTFDRNEPKDFCRTAKAGQNIQVQKIVVTNQQTGVVIEVRYR